MGYKDICPYLIIKRMSSFESTRCVICYENKAKHFCIGCKKSSGVCCSCYNDWEDVNNTCYASMPCPICKIPMEYARLNFRFNFDIESGYGLATDRYFSYQKKEKLEDIVYNAIELGKDKKD